MGAPASTSINSNRSSSFFSLTNLIAKQFRREAFLRQYCVDDLLQTLLEEVLLHRPDDPVAYVANRLAEEHEANNWPPCSHPRLGHSSSSIPDAASAEN